MADSTSFDVESGKGVSAGPFRLSCSFLLKSCDLLVFSFVTLLLTVKKKKKKKKKKTSTTTITLIVVRIISCK